MDEISVEGVKADKKEILEAFTYHPLNEQMNFTNKAE